MMEQLRKLAIERAMKILSSPAFARMMSNQHLMNALAKGFELQGHIRTQVEGGLRQIALGLNLATRDEVQGLLQELGKIQDSIGDLQAQIDQQ